MLYILCYRIRIYREDIYSGEWDSGGIKYVVLGEYYEIFGREKFLFLKGY